MTESTDIITCPNCESKMNRGAPCPECDHADLDGCECQACCPEDEATQSNVDRFDHLAWCVVCLRPNSDVVEMTSNLADAHVAACYANAVEREGGHIFAVVSAGTLVAALMHILPNARRPQL